jgi:hypothetical protein
VLDLDVHIIDTDVERWQRYLLHAEVPVPELVREAGDVTRMRVAGRLIPKASGDGCGSPMGARAGGEEAREQPWHDYLRQRPAWCGFLQPGFVGGAAMTVANVTERRAL